MMNNIFKEVKKMNNQNKIKEMMMMINNNNAKFQTFPVEEVEKIMMNREETKVVDTPRGYNYKNEHIEVNIEDEGRQFTFIDEHLNYQEDKKLIDGFLRYTGEKLEGYKIEYRDTPGGYNEDEELPTFLDLLREADDAGEFIEDNADFMEAVGVREDDRIGLLVYNIKEDQIGDLELCFEWVTGLPHQKCDFDGFYTKTAYRNEHYTAGGIVTTSMYELDKVLSVMYNINEVINEYNECTLYAVEIKTSTGLNFTDFFEEYRYQDAEYILNAAEEYTGIFETITDHYNRIIEEYNSDNI